MPTTENSTITVVLPIYYTQTFKTKAPKVWLVGLNNYRNWFYTFKNKVKQHYHDLATAAVGNNRIEGKYTCTLEVYLKNKQADPSNVAAVMEKFVLDGLCSCGALVDDTSSYHIGTTWTFIEIDKENPRCVVTIHPTEKDCDV